MAGPWDSYAAPSPPPWQRYGGDAAPADQSRSALGEIGNQFKAGVEVDLPRMLAKATQAVAPSASGVSEFATRIDRTSGLQGKSVAVRVDLGGRRSLTEQLALGSKQRSKRREST